MLDVGYSFSKSGLYKTIEPGEKDEYIEYVKTLPLNPKPEAFGLHENAEITTAMNETSKLLEDILSMQPRASAGKGKSREQIIGDQAQYL